MFIIIVYGIHKKKNGEHYTLSIIKYHTRESIRQKLNINLNYHSLRHTHDVCRK